MKTWTFIGIGLALAALALLLPLGTKQTSFAQADLQAKTGSTGEALSLRVATYNIHIGKDAENHLNLEETIRTLREADADLIGLQEVERHSVRTRFQDQPKLIAEALGMDVHFEPALRVGPMEFGNVLLSRYPILSTERIELKSSQEDRVALLATLDVAGQPLRVLVTHLGLVQAERERDIQRLVERLAATDVPTVVMGDFNVERGASEMQPWWQTFAPAHEETLVTFPSSQKQIDHVLVSAPLVPRTSHVVPSAASDHLLLVSELQWM